MDVEGMCRKLVSFVTKRCTYLTLASIACQFTVQQKHSSLQIMNQTSFHLCF